MSRKDPAPVFLDAFELCTWVVNHFDAPDSAVGRAVCAETLAMIRAVSIALKRSDRPDQIEAADEHLIAVRLNLRLARACGRMDERQMLHALGLADAIGRQLGGWLRSLGPV